MRFFKKALYAQAVPSEVRAVKRPKQRGTPALLILALILSTVFFSLLVGIGAWIIAVGLLLPVAFVFFMAVTGAFSSLHFGGEGPFWAMFIAVCGTAFLDTISPVHTRGLVTVILLFSSLIAARGLLVFYRNSSLGKTMAVLFTVFFVLGVAGAIHAHPHFRAVLYQLAYNLKLPLMIGLGFAVTLSEKGLHRFWRIQQAILVIGVLGCLFELASPHYYHVIARGGAFLGGANPIVPFLPLMAGPFAHPGVLAFTSSLFFCFFLTRQLAGDGNRWENYLTMCGFVGLMFMSGERQETFDALITAVILVFVAKVRFSFRAVAFVACAVILAGSLLLAALGSERVTRMAAEHGLAASTHALDMPRAVMYSDSFYLAKREFPLGTGFGTFGGDASKNFDRSVYESLGYHRFWWYRADMYLLDTYWPNLIAESGFIGGGSILVFALLMAAYALYHAWTAVERRAQMWWRMALTGQLLAFGSSLTGPSYGDPSTVGIPFIFFGIAFVYSLQKKREQKTALPSAVTAPNLLQPVGAA